MTRIIFKLSDTSKWPIDGDIYKFKIVRTETIMENYDTVLIMYIELILDQKNERTQIRTPHQ